MENDEYDGALTGGAALAATMLSFVRKRQRTVSHGGPSLHWLLKNDVTVIHGEEAYACRLETAVSLQLEPLAATIFLRQLLQQYSQDSKRGKVGIGKVGAKAFQRCMEDCTSKMTSCIADYTCQSRVSRVLDVPCLSLPLQTFQCCETEHRRNNRFDLLSYTTYKAQVP